MTPRTRWILTLIIVLTCALGGCSLFERDGGGDGGERALAVPVHVHHVA